MRRPLPLFLVAVGAFAAFDGWATDVPTPSPSAPAAHDSASPPIDCPLQQKHFDASTMRPFAETEKWIEFLDKPGRDAWQKPAEIVKALRLNGTETLVDVGAGSGYFTFRFAKALPKGKVVATDVDPEMVRHIHHEVMTRGIKNVRAVLAEPNDPTVDPAADVVFVCDVIHHVAGREAWLRKMSSEMKTGAKLAVIEFKEGKLPEGPPEGVKIPEAKLKAMLRDAGFTLESDHPVLLPYQVFLVFEKTSSSVNTAPTE
jgi:ubiquinone/menaquinone biosynthesis C-methylase UbiE